MIIVNNSVAINIGQDLAHCVLVGRPFDEIRFSGDVVTEMDAITIDKEWGLLVDRGARAVKEGNVRSLEEKRNLVVDYDKLSLFVEDSKLLKFLKLGRAYNIHLILVSGCLDNVSNAIKDFVKVIDM